MLRACSSLLASILKESPVTGWRVDFSKGKVYSKLNGLFVSDLVHGMPEGKETSVLIWVSFHLQIREQGYWIT